MMDTPCYNQVNSKTCFKTICASELSVFNMATAFQYLVKHFDGPPNGVPKYTLTGFFKAVSLRRGK